MKALFLDVDGVLNSYAWTQTCAAAGGDLLHVDPATVARVLRVLDTTRARLVLSSTWRFVPALVQYLQAQGLPIHGLTPRLDAFGPRCDEIAAWLTAHPDCTTFAILDDGADAGFGALAPAFVKVDERVGLTDTNADAAIAILARDAALTYNEEVLRFA